VEAVREIILSAHPGITERIKWNAPSFCIDGDDRITFRLQPGDRVQLVFHRGARKRDDATNVLLRGRLRPDVKAKRAAFKDLVRRWMIATSGGG
jgi:hypothetical protein